MKVGCLISKWSKNSFGPHYLNKEKLVKIKVFLQFIETQSANAKFERKTNTFLYKPIWNRTLKA